jgi:hypothetical protein
MSCPVLPHTIRATATSVTEDAASVDAAPGEENSALRERNAAPETLAAQQQERIAEPERQLGLNSGKPP